MGQGIVCEPGFEAEAQLLRAAGLPEGPVVDRLILAGEPQPTEQDVDGERVTIAHLWTGAVRYYLLIGRFAIHIRLLTHAEVLERRAAGKDFDVRMSVPSPATWFFSVGSMTHCDVYNTNALALARWQ